MDYTCIERILDDPDFPESRHEIQPKQAVSIAATRGMVVRGERGTLWLTQEGRSQDYILIPGAQYQSPDDRKIVVSSFGTGGAITVIRLIPGSGRGFGGSPLRIDRAAMARLEREARGARARMIGKGISKLWKSAREMLRPLTIRYGGPVLGNK